MKIVMLGDLYDERLQYQENLFAKYYVKHGHDVTMIASTFDNAFDYYAAKYDKRAPAREYWDGGAKVIKLPYSLNFLNRLRRFAGVRQILERESPDLIYCHDIHLNLTDAVWYRRTHPNCRIILDYHADFSNSARNWMSVLLLHKLTRKQVLNHCRPHIEKILPIVPAGADFLHEIYSVPHDAMRLLPLGADTDLALETRARHEGTAVREELGIPATATAIFTGGKLTAAKRTHLLIEAFVEIDDPSLHMLIVGDGGAYQQDYKERLIALARGNGRVHFVGWVDGADVYRYMDACDFAVFPASQSVLWQQALSMGLPLIVGHIGVADPSYMNLYDNMTILREADVTVPVLVSRIRQLASDEALLEVQQRGALRVADEILNYNRQVVDTLSAPADSKLRVARRAH